MIVEKSEVEDESKIEEIFNTPLNDKYSRMEFSLEETDRIFILIKNGLDKCQEIEENLYDEIKDFKYIYYAYNCCYKDLNKF